MKWRQYDIPCTSNDGSVTVTLRWVIPVYTADEADALLSLKPSDNTVLSAKSGLPTEYGYTLLDEYGLRYYQAPYITCSVAFVDQLNTEWLDMIKEHFTGLYDVTTDMFEMPVTSTTSVFAYREFTTKAKNGAGTGSTKMYSEAGGGYRPSEISLYGEGTFYTVRPCYYGSGTGSNTAKYMSAYVSIYALVDDGRAISGSFTGYMDYTPAGLKGSLNVVSSSNTAFARYFLDNDYKEVDPTDPNKDPYAGGGESGTGGGNGTFDWGGDSVGIPDLPAISATDAGFITLFNPSLDQLHSLASYMWSDLFDLSGWQKIFADPMDAILGLSIVPVAVPDGGASVVKVGNISTNVSMTKAAQQYISVDCGTITIKEQYGSYLDYEPFSKAEIYLPFIGMHALSVDDVMGKAVHVVYHVDILSGACVAYVEIDGSVHYTFIGQCSSSIPITGNDWTNVINGVLNIAGSIGSMVATGGATAPLALGAVASTSVNSMKPTVEKSGSLSGTGGLMANKRPYIILTRPRQCVPKNQNKYLGYPSFITEDLGSISGYTEVESVRLKGAYGTEQEMDEIMSLLKSGVVF